MNWLKQSCQLSPEDSENEKFLFFNEFILKDTVCAGFLGVPLCCAGRNPGVSRWNIQLSSWRGSGKGITRHVFFFPLSDCYLFLSFPSQVSANSDINKMTNTNLAVVFGPNLLWAKDAAITLKAINPINTFTKFLLDNQRELFENLEAWPKGLPVLAHHATTSFFPPLLPFPFPHCFEAMGKSVDALGNEKSERGLWRWCSWACEWMKEAIKFGGGEDDLPILGLGVSIWDVRD